ncbi:hypothetical protein F5Y18DRAFT_384188 [Xylariaceae sp. FL1019]|nr:hypothetical protein F5Y18DRAFT_384188 [Xylariaceae sp. FL1019]
MMAYVKDGERDRRLTDVPYTPLDDTITTNRIPVVQRTSDGNYGASDTEDLGYGNTWMPWTMKPPALSTLIILSLSIAVLLEVLARRAATEGGLALSQSVDSLPGTVRYATAYLPTAIAILYAILWSLVDVDAKRIQPWLEVSRSGGSTAENSLLLDYPFQFLALVPYKAFKQGHWPVFYISSIGMLISWLITPLQSSIFSVGVITLSQPVPVSTPNPLVDITDQPSLIDANVLNTAFAITWLDQPYPSSTTASYALLPFESYEVPPFATNVHLTSWTWQLKTDLSCWSAAVEPLAPNHDLFSFDNGRGCKTAAYFFQDGGKPPPGLPQPKPYNMFYIPYYDDPWNEFALIGPDCSKNSTHQFLAISAMVNETLMSDPKATTWYDNVTALFCETQYSKQNVTVTLSSGSLRPDETSILPNGISESLDDSEFNITAFEYLIGTGRPSIEDLGDFPDDQTLDQYRQLADRQIVYPVTNMVGFAVGLSNLSAPEFLDEVKLAAAYKRAHQSLFSSAVARLLSNSTGSEPASNRGTLHFTAYGVIVSRLISAIVEILLLFVATMAGLLLFCCARCKSLLPRDPSSIAEIIGTLYCSEETMQDFADLDCATDAVLKTRLGRQSYLLKQEKRKERVVLALQRNEEDLEGLTPIRSSQLTTNYKPFKPWALRPLSGMAFVGVLVAGLITLVYLKHEETRLGGLRMPIDSMEASLLLENYIPVLFATVLETVWTLVNHIYCHLEPFSKLQKGNSRPGVSIATKYTTLPSQLVIWRAIKARQLHLTCVCFISVLANILPISLGGLFSNIPRAIAFDTRVKPLYTATATRTTILNSTLESSVTAAYSDHFQIAMANLSSDTPLPSWIDNTNFYLPFSNHDASTLSTADRMKAKTLGFGIKASCNPVIVNDFSGNVAIVYSTSNSSKDFVSIQKYTDNQYTLGLLASFHKNASGQFEYNDGVSGVPPPSTSAPYAMEAILGTTDRSITWGRMLKRPNEAPAANGTIHSTFIDCQYSLQVANFSVTVDNQGNVINSEKLDDAHDGFDAWSKNTTDSILQDLSSKLENQGFYHSYWHNNTVTGDWTTHLLTLLMRSRAIVDPTQDGPGADVLVLYLEDLYRRLGAIIFGLNKSLFEEAAEDVALIPGTIIRTETRIFLDQTAFAVSVAILAVNLITAIAVYSRPAVKLPRMPSSIASILAYSLSSRAAEDCRFNQGGNGDNSMMRHTYTFGKYIGVDQKPHIGIEREPFVSRIVK